ncbi:uncharacterized protein ACLA_097140 [Aspergillus clavatus NRRL 1]|uniref:Uncharacterized protein n=1 Tax=Aspergillus clavatus (strain ATCC 1007 / CBS 513.65 / DSM 816 / NCTC 3887 / NRRL 1 / QM 1276 / 107) TaxID=344612 RepID=A1CMJ1_ASPCL|nr:uncharacterized protein ACLA_097140 [Aspergillus clavatus NRRL 1]EAW08778.1 hypothetical protein ACLA_097140 [Aspergillus clavatus NRRL 1]
MNTLPPFDWLIDDPNNEYIDFPFPTDNIIDLLPENPTREELINHWTRLLQRYFPFSNYSSPTHVPRLSNDTDQKYCLAVDHYSSMSHAVLSLRPRGGPIARVHFLHVYVVEEPQEKEVVVIDDDGEDPDKGDFGEAKVELFEDLQGRLVSRLLRRFYYKTLEGRNMTLHGAICVGRHVRFFALEPDGSFGADCWWGEEELAADMNVHMPLVQDRLMQISHEIEAQRNLGHS